jgi:hypothetical protein
MEPRIAEAQKIINKLKREEQEKSIKPYVKLIIQDVMS